MLSRTHRFQGRKRIMEVYRSGRSTRGQYFNTRTLKNGGEAFHVAVVVSKKVAKKAVERNRIRRKLYSCFNSEELKGIGAVDIIINVHSADVANTSQPELTQQLRKLIGT